MATNREIKNYMLLNYTEHMDCGEVNCTLLAEDAVAHFDDYNPDDTTPEKYYELAFNVSQIIEK